MSDVHSLSVFFDFFVTKPRPLHGGNKPRGTGKGSPFARPRERTVFMGTVTQAFQQMIEALTLTDTKEGEVNHQRQGLRRKLDQYLSISEEFVAGSFGRRTAIHPLHDVDLLLVLNPREHGHLLQRPPAECLQLLQGAVHKCYPEKGSPRVQKRSVNIEFTGTGIGFDLVPAFADQKKDVYWIPDRERPAWIQTNPRVHREKCNEANERAGNKLKVLVKLGKHWNRKEGGLLKSFHLEVMSYGVFGSAPGGYPEGLRHLFNSLSEAVLSRCPDPAGLNYVDEGMDQPTRTNIRNKLLGAAKIAGDALAADKKGDANQAHKLWRGLLGSVYPEAGR